MVKLLKHICALIPTLLLASLIVIVPQLDNRELMDPTQSGKSFGLLWGMLGYVVIVLFITALKCGNIRIRVTVIDLLLAAYSLMAAVSYWLHPADQLQLLTFGALVLFYLGVRALNRRYLILLLFAVVISGTIQAIYGNLQLWGYYPSNHGIFRMTGSFFNPGPYAGYLAAIVPISLGLYLFNIQISFPDQSPFFLKLCSYFNHIKSFFKNISSKTHFFYNNSRENSRQEEQESSPGLSGYITMKSFFLISIISVCLVLPASRSRAAWLGAIAGCFFVFQTFKQSNAQTLLQTFKQRSLKPFKHHKKVLVVAGILFLAATLVGMYKFKQGSADGRLLIWKVSSGMIKDKPVFGHGAGKFAADYMNYQAAYFMPNPDVPEAMQADNVTYAYNEFLKLTVEKGLIGLLLGLAVLWSLFFGKSKKKTEGRSWKTEVRRQILEASLPEREAVEGRSQKLKNPTLLAAQAGLLSILVFALFSYPSEILPIKMLFVLFAAVVATHQNPIRLLQLPTQRAAFTGKVVWYAALAIVLITVYPASQYLARQYQAYKSWKDASDIYNIGAYTECLEDFELAYTHLKANGTFLVQYGKALEMAEKYKNSIAILSEAKQHLNNAILYTCLGNNYKALGKHTEAEQAYLHAWHMAPARFYPLYLLAKLYDETGQQEKAVAMAKKVMEKEVKIESTAIEEIREEMRTIIEKSEAELFNKNNIHTDNDLNPIYKGTKEGAYRSVVLTAKFMLQKW